MFYLWVGLDYHNCLAACHWEGQGRRENKKKANPSLTVHGGAGDNEKCFLSLTFVIYLFFPLSPSLWFILSVYIIWSFSGWALMLSVVFGVLWYAHGDFVSYVTFKLDFSQLYWWILAVTLTAFVLRWDLVGRKSVDLV